MNHFLLAALAASALILTACGGAGSEPAPAKGPDPAPVAETAPAIDPVAVPPSGAPASARNDPAVIHFRGFGPATFGADEEQVRMAWGAELDAPPASEGSTCRFLSTPTRGGSAADIAFMLEDGAFVRYDVRTARFVAIGDLTVGMTAPAVMAAFPGRVESMPHKYVDGARYLVVTPAEGGDTRLVFDVNAEGAVTQWRIGRLPQALYVEGCG